MPARDLVGPAAALLLLGLGLQGLHRDPALGLHAVGVQFAAAGAGGRVSVELFHRVRARLHPLAIRLLGARRRCDDDEQQRRPDFHRTLPARNPRPSRWGGAPISMVDSPRLELSTRSASGPGDNQAVGPLRQPSKRRWCWTGRLPRSEAGRRTVNLEPQGQALGLKHGLLSLKAPDFSPGDVYARYSISTLLSRAATAPCGRSWLVQTEPQPPGPAAPLRSVFGASGTRARSGTTPGPPISSEGRSSLPAAP